ncbi:MAG TPA: trypsin-like peptidase domain-containing protein [Saprospiraceae bacterium]|nr:trypsin-like peptidase domain-containing protein [Saprospiraceae bacterium]HMP22690.1 trypsin-like peptidase domain-containing protein [Saprospiraceae bacterium]
MKQIFSLIVAGMIGGLVTLGGAFLLQKKTTPATDTFAQQVNVPAYFNNNSQTPNKVTFDFTEAAAKAMPAVVHISASAKKPTAQNNKRPQDDFNPFRFFFGDEFLNEGPKQGSGSGVIYSPDGYIITNNHVVEFADEIEVTLNDNRKFKATLIGRDDRTDMAVIKIEANGLQPLELADSDQAKVGEWVLAVGNPFNLTSTVTAGIISAKGRSLNLLNSNSAIEAFIQTDAAVNPGNSGGALVDAEGRLLGINTAIATRNGSFQGYSFAIPVNLMKRIADDIIEYGDYRRALLGVNIYPLDSEEASKIGVNISQGVVVDRVMDGSSAQYAGVLPKDVITKVNGREIKSVPELQEIVGRAKVGDVINLTVNRQGKVQEIPVKLKAEVK